MHDSEMRARETVRDWDVDQRSLGSSGCPPETLALIPNPDRIIRCEDLLAELEGAWQAAGRRPGLRPERRSPPTAAARSRPTSRSGFRGRTG